MRWLERHVGLEEIDTQEYSVTVDLGEWVVSSVYTVAVEQIQLCLPF